jgi:beta-lactam-binding protein with PASTA domain/tRNA A-37 threonylcarbamoyl transferase component Bud32
MTSITDQIGRVLAGRYRLVAPIGTGASAHVYAADDARLHRRVAVKLLHPSLAAEPAFLRRFRAEAQAAAALNHPNVLRVFDWGEEEDGPFVVLEYLGGGSLRALLDVTPRLSPAQVAQIGAQAAHGLAYAHRRGLVHRDVKPANLLFDDDGRLRVADFGLARALAEASATEPLGAVLGTARYASPEQAEGRPVDDRTDVYSLALVLYEALTGRVPFAADTALATLAARVGAPLPIVPELGAFAPVLAAATITEPIARLDAAALALDLEMLAAELGPAEPLPLVRLDPRAGGIGARAGLLDPTEPVRLTATPPDAPIGGADAPPGAGPAGSAGRGAGAAGAFAPPGEAAPGAPARGRGPRRRRRRAVWALSSVVAVLLLAGSGAAAVRYLVFDHVVPRLALLPLAQARREASHEGLVLVVVGRRYSSSVPAGDVLAQSPLPGALERARARVDVVLSLGHAPVALPEVVGRPFTEAAALLAARHLRAVVAGHPYSTSIPAGDVVSTVPAAGLVPYGSTVKVLVSAGFPPVPVPSVVGETFAAARAAIVGAGLAVIEHQEYSEQVPAGAVVSTDPSAGTLVAHGGSVIVVVSLGPQYVTIPTTLADDPLPQAEAVLRSLGLVVGAVYAPPIPPQYLFVTGTSPGLGQSVVVGTTVDITAI